MGTEIYEAAQVRNVLVLKDVSQFTTRKKEIYSPCLGDNVLGKEEKSGIKNAAFKICPCEKERQSKHTATKLGKCDFWGFGKLNTLSKAFGCPHFIQSVVHGWVIWQHRNVSGIWKHHLRWQKVLPEGLWAIFWQKTQKTALARLQGLEALPLELLNCG